jgi:hypothetical protein
LDEATFDDFRITSIPWEWFTNNDPWFLEQFTTANFFKKVQQNIYELTELTIQIWQGISSGKDGVFYIDYSTVTTENLEHEILRPLLKGQDVGRYEVNWSGKYVIYPYDKSGSVLDENLLKRKYPNTYRYLQSKRDDLKGRDYFDNLGKAWFELWNQRNPKYFEQQKLITPEIASKNSFSFDTDNYYANTKVYGLLPRKELAVGLLYILAVLNSNLLMWLFQKRSVSKAGGFYAYKTQFISDLPIRRVTFTTPAHERERLKLGAVGAYDIGDNAGVLQRVQAHIDADKTDVVHDLLAHLAQCMIDLNKQKQAEVKRFLAWLEKRLRIQPKNDGSTGIDSLSGKTILQGYLGDYQKGEGELPWREFHYRLHQNRNRFAVSLSDVDGEIQREYEKSLATLIPIKRDLARTDALIDKIVYRLYGLTDEEIELIERPQYEQALTDAKAQVVADKAIKDDEEKIERIAGGILPAARRFFERVEPKSFEELLDSELPNWRSLPPEAPTFLLTGDYNLRTLPDHMDFSTSVIPYTKAVEVVLSTRIFIPFRQQYTDADCTNDFLKKFMRGEKDLTLGSFMIILSSSRETALRNFISRTYADAATRMFGAQGLVNILNDEEMRDIRNKAAHDEVLSRDEAQQTRSWAMQILGHV